MTKETTRAAIQLLLRRSELLLQWERAVLRDDAVPTAKTLPGFRLRDYVPRMFDTIVDALRGDSFEAMALEARARSFARVHAIERIDGGFALDEVLRELAHLETVLVTELGHAHDARAVIAKAIADARSVTERAFVVSETHVWTGASGEEESVTSKRVAS